MKRGRREKASRRKEGRVAARAQPIALHRLGPAINASLDAIFVLAAVRNARGRIVDFRVADANARGLRFVGASRAMVINRSVSEIAPSVHTNGFFDDYLRVIKSGRPLEMVAHVPPPFPQTKWAGAKYVQRHVIRVGDGVLVTVRDVTEQKKAELTLRALPRHISQAQAAERQRVARELHDGVTQLLIAARFQIAESQRLAAKGADAMLCGHLDGGKRTIDRAVEEVRRISHGLRPRELDEAGLVASLSRLLADFRDRTGIATEFSRGRASQLPAAVMEALYRITQEALTNIERHARARHVSVSFRCSRKRVALTIADDGRGLMPEGQRSAAGLGVLHMRERTEFVGGSLVFSNRARKGTFIAVEIPLLSPV